MLFGTSCRSVVWDDAALREACAGAALADSKRSAIQRGPQISGDRSEGRNAT
jgi:hypothetical protein